jgi:hypothetical protein
MLKPTFSERTALEIRARIIKWLREHFADKSNWHPFRLTNGPNGDCAYRYPVIRDFAASGEFDDTGESIFMRVLKDMNNFGTVDLNRDPNDPRAASSQVVLQDRFLTPLPEGVHFNSGSQMYTVSDLSALD